jgi:putative transposase
MGRRKNKDVDNRAYKFRLLPNAEQIVLINKTFGCVRFVYNNLLADRNAYYHSTGGTLKKEVSEYKQDHDFLKEVDSLALANSKINLETSFKNFFEHRSKFPKFHKKGKNDSYTTNMVNGNIEIVQHGIKLPKLGVVKAKLHRTIGKDETIKSCTISRVADKYYIAVITELPKINVPKVDPKSVPDSRVVGFDFSVPHFYVDSFGNQIEYPKYYRQMENKLKKEQKRLSKKVYKSNNYYKQLRKVQKLHAKVMNQRKDFLHKLSNDLVKNYDILCFEDLDLSALKKSLRLGKSISDEGFGMFRTFVQYKAERAGKHFVKLNKWYASTKTCSHCGYKNDEITLETREWYCPNCNTYHLRDHNAAINIKREGLRLVLAK